MPDRRCQRLGERRADTLARLRSLQPDKINDNAAAEIAQPDLARDHLGGGEIGGEPGCAPGDPLSGLPLSTSISTPARVGSK